MANKKEWIIGKYRVRKLDTLNWVVEARQDKKDGAEGELSDTYKNVGYYSNIEGCERSLKTLGVEECDNLKDLSAWCKFISAELKK